MTPVELLALVKLYGPTVVGIVAKLSADIKAGRGEKEITQADWDELTRLSRLTGADVYAALEIALPGPLKP